MGVGHRKEGDQRMMAKLVLVGSCTGQWQGGIRTHRGSGVRTLFYIQRDLVMDEYLEDNGSQVSH